MMTRADMLAAVTVMRDVQRNRHRVFDRISWRGAEAVIIEPDDHRFAVLLPTNELPDWWRYNFRFLPRPGERYWWHRGFIKYAEPLYGFVKASTPNQILGFSLGGGAGQIIGSSLKIPTVCAGTPAALWSPWSTSDIEGEEYVTCIVGAGDPVCRMPPWWLGYRHVGYVQALPVERHSLESYVEVLA